MKKLIVILMCFAFVVCIGKAAAAEDELDLAKRHQDKMGTVLASAVNEQRFITYPTPKEPTMVLLPTNDILLRFPTYGKGPWKKYKKEQLGEAALDAAIKDLSHRLGINEKEVEGTVVVYRETTISIEGVDFDRENPYFEAATKVDHFKIGIAVDGQTYIYDATETQSYNYNPGVNIGTWKHVDADAEFSGEIIPTQWNIDTGELYIPYGPKYFIADPKTPIKDVVIGIPVSAETSDLAQRKAVEETIELRGNGVRMAPTLAKEPETLKQLEK